MNYIDKINESILIGLKNSDKQEIIDKAFNLMAGFSEQHSNKNWPVNVFVGNNNSFVVNISNVKISDKFNNKIFDFKKYINYIQIN